MKQLKLAVAALAVAVPMSFASTAFAEKQPNMTAAQKHIKQAEESLDKAAHNKGGHRAKAIELLKQAEAEVQAGIEFANQHPEKKK